MAQGHRQPAKRDGGDVTVFPGPAALGRGAVVAEGQQAPAPFAGAPRIRIDEQVVGDRAVAVAAAARLRRRWATRRPVVVELATHQDVLKEQERDARPPWQLGSEFAFPLEQLRFLVWSNNYDLRGGEPIWWHARIAWRDTAAEPSAVGDARAAGVGDFWIDGGPRGPVGGLSLPVVHADSVADRRLTVTSDGPVVDPLAADQRAAVAHPSGPARVIAPAGSGKTRVLAARLRHLAHQRGVDADHLTAVAYNKRAQVELRRRVGDLGGRVLTLHALGFRIVREARPDIRLVDEPATRAALERIVPVRPKPNTDVLAPYLEGFEQVRVGLVAPEDVARVHPDAPQFPRVFEAWRRWLRDHGAIDYDEQIHGAVEILLTDPARRAQFQRSCRLLLVDEFQDLSPAFLLLVRLLAAPAWQVYGVGDDDQTIYSYRNARPAHLVQFHRWFPHAASYALQTNYRCPTDVVWAAARLLARNRERVPKTIRPAADARAEGLVVRKADPDRLASLAVEQVRRLLGEDVAPRDVAVLARVHALLLPVQVALVVAGVPTDSQVGVDMLERTGVRAALAWLRLVAGRPHALDGADVAEAARRSPRRIRGETLRALGARPAWSPRALTGYAYDRLEVWEGRALRGWLDDLSEVRAAARDGGTVAALRTVRDLLEEGLAELDTSTTASKQTSSHLDDLTALIQVAPLRPDPAGFEPWLRGVLTSKDTTDAPEGRVQLATVHATKGLEWPHVLLFGANEGLMPHRLSAGPDLGGEEERRVFHVALTRARHQVVVLADRDHPSPYLAEMLEPAELGAPSEKPAEVRPPSHPTAPEAKPRAAARQPKQPAVVATVGARLRAPGGITGTVHSIESGGVLLQLRSGARLHVPFGQVVTVDGEDGRLARPTD